MSDFLADIAERSLTTVQVIRPRPLSFYEPFQATVALGLGQELLSEQDSPVLESNGLGLESITPVTMTTRELPVCQGKVDSSAMQAQRASISTGTADSRPVVPTLAEQPADQGKYQPAAMQSSSEHVMSIGPNVPAVDTISPALEIRSKYLRQSADEHQTADPSSPPATVKGSQGFGVPDHQSKVTGTLSKHILVKPEIERVELAKSAAAQLPLQPRAPLCSREETTWGNNNESMQHGAPTPTIHVTIGRIEVRATPAPIQNQSKPKPPVSMSLDEYLQRRNGGGR